MMATPARRPWRWGWMAVVLVWACSPDPAPTAPSAPLVLTPPGRTSAQLARELGSPDPTFLTAARGAQLTATTVRFYAVRGQRREGALYYASTDGNPADSAELVRLVVPPGAGLRRPDGSRVMPGDSVLITMTVVDPEHMIIELEPSGLRFTPGEPAELELTYLRANEDLNGDGRVNGADHAIEDRLRIWRQEEPEDPWLPLASRHDPPAKRLRSSIEGFTRYAIAY